MRLDKLVEVSAHAARRWAERIGGDVGAARPAILEHLARCTRVRRCGDGRSYVAERPGGPRFIIGPGVDKPLSVVTVIQGRLR